MRKLTLLKIYRERKIMKKIVFMLLTLVITRAYPAQENIRPQNTVMLAAATLLTAGTAATIHALHYPELARQLTHNLTSTPDRSTYLIVAGIGAGLVTSVYLLTRNNPEQHNTQDPNQEIGR